MYVKNLLNAGDFVAVVPLGLPMTLEYSDSGAIKRVYRDWGESKVDVTAVMLPRILRENIVPRSVAPAGSSTFISGVLYTSYPINGSGELPDSIALPLVEDFISSSHTYNFFAGAIGGVAVAVSGAVAVRQWLTFAGFNVLPGFVVPIEMNQEKFDKLVKSSGFNFIYPLISHYIVFHQNDCLFESTQSYELAVSELTTSVSDRGDIIATITDTSTGDSMTCDYSDVVKFNIHEGDHLVLDMYDSIRYNYANKSLEPVSKQITCKYCGRVIHVAEAGSTRCADPRCNSNLYFPTNHFLKTLGLNPITREKYDEVVTEVGTLYALPDVLDHIDIDLSAVPITLPQAMAAMVTNHPRLGVEFFSDFCSRCHNSVDVIDYYITHEDKILIDLEGSDARYQELTQWLKDPTNALEMSSFIHDSRLTIVKEQPKFEGAPIFRGKKIQLTGKFTHGSINEVKRILSSYGASVYDDQDKRRVDCLVIGDAKEGVSGGIVNFCRSAGIPIFEELSFFQAYEIDQDLAQNL